jgi:hypothetical protein
MSGPTTAPLTIPMGFSAQIKALQESQRTQALRLTTLEHENAILKVSTPHFPDLLARIEALEQQNVHLTARRKEAVAQLLNLRALHQEATNAFLVRASDMEADDLEGMLGVYGTSMTSVLNHHSRALGKLCALGHGALYGVAVLQDQGRCPVGYAYPLNYSQAGYCHAHQIPYPCRICGR